MKTHRIIPCLVIALSSLLSVPALTGAETANGSQASYVQARDKAREEMKAAGVPDPGKDPNILNNLGYRALYEGEGGAEAAVRYFRWNLALFPRYMAQLQDSLAEGYLGTGNAPATVEWYSKSLLLHPNNPHAATVVEKLKADPSNLLTLQMEAKEAYLAEKAKREK